MIRSIFDAPQSTFSQPYRHNLSYRQVILGRWAGFPRPIIPTPHEVSCPVPALLRPADIATRNGHECRYDARRGENAAQGRRGGPFDRDAQGGRELDLRVPDGGLGDEDHVVD